MNSYQATRFRIWATKTLREFIIKGFALDDERLKQGKRVFGKDYFEELLERIREIRAERGILMKMADWAEFLNNFLELSTYPILQDKGRVSALEARLKAEGEYEVYRKSQDAEYISDFDREIKRIEGTHSVIRRKP